MPRLVSIVVIIFSPSPWPSPSREREEVFYKRGFAPLKLPITEREIF
jgi:hypothetical protein